MASADLEVCSSVEARLFWVLFALIGVAILFFIELLRLDPVEFTELSLFFVFRTAAVAECLGPTAPKFILLFSYSAGEC